MYILCRPEGGIADMLVQISKCFDYAKHHCRSLILDCQNTQTFQDTIGHYLKFPRFEYFDVCEKSKSISQTIGREFFPDEVFPRVNLKYQYSQLEFDKAGGIYFGGVFLAFDFSKTYKEPLLIHHQCGGGLPSESLLKGIVFSKKVSIEFYKRVCQMPFFYRAYHCRNTDIICDLDEALRVVQAMQGKVFLATDSYAARTMFTEKLPGKTVSFSDIPDLGGRNIHHTTCSPIDKRKRNEDAFLDLLMLGFSNELKYSQTLVGCKKISGYSLLAEHIKKNRVGFFLRALDLRADRKILILSRLLMNSLVWN
jgi:hypothetical protein